MFGFKATNIDNSFENDLCDLRGRVFSSKIIPPLPTITSDEAYEKAKILYQKALLEVASDDAESPKAIWVDNLCVILVKYEFSQHH